MELKPKSRLENIIRFCAQKLRYFTSDHVNLLSAWEATPIGKRDVCIGLLKAKGQKLIKRTEKCRISDQNKSNSIPRVVWKSLIVRKGKVDHGL